MCTCQYRARARRLITAHKYLALAFRTPAAQFAHAYVTVWRDVVTQPMRYIA